MPVFFFWLMKTLAHKMTHQSPEQVCIKSLCGKTDSTRVQKGHRSMPWRKIIQTYEECNFDKFDNGKTDCQKRLKRCLISLQLSY